MTPVTEAPVVGPSRAESTEELLAVLARVPEVAGRDLTLTPLSGGITNRNFLVTPSAGVGASAAEMPARFVLRLAGNDTHLLGISREVEHAATQAAAGVGVGPEVVAFIRPEGYLLTRFIEGRPITPAEMRTRDGLRALGETLRRIHEAPPIPGLFIPYRIVEVYQALAAARGVPIPPEYELARAIARRIELACLARPVELRPCHNDLLNANFIDDGVRIRIVDWEYAGMGDPFFDLGNVSVNHDLAPEDDAALLAAYDDTSAADPVRLARLTLMRVMSDYREAMWGVLQQGISALDVDFRAYAAEHFERLLANASGVAFERALQDAGAV